MEINKEVFKEQVIQGFTILQLQEHWDCSRTKITSHKKKWDLVGLSPNSKKRDNGDGTKTCNICNLEKDVELFYSNGFTPKGTKKLKPSCISCENKDKRDKNYSNIISILKDLGKEYKCEICGYNKNHAALTFHHTSKEKNFEISDSKTFSREKLEQEIILCKLLCQNCHHEVHHPDLDI